MGGPPLSVTRQVVSVVSLCSGKTAGARGYHAQSKNFPLSGQQRARSFLANRLWFCSLLFLDNLRSNVVRAMKTHETTSTCYQLSRGAGVPFVFGAGAAFPLHWLGVTPISPFEISLHHLIPPPSKKCASRRCSRFFGFSRQQHLECSGEMFEVGSTPTTPLKFHHNSKRRRNKKSQSVPFVPQLHETSCLHFSSEPLRVQSCEGDRRIVHGFAPTFTLRYNLGNISTK